jgi:hypothetical protein
VYASPVACGVLHPSLVTVLIERFEPLAEFAGAQQWGTFSDDGNTITGEWVYPGGGGYRANGWPRCTRSVLALCTDTERGSEH